MAESAPLIRNNPSNRRNKHPLLLVHGAWHGAWCWQKYFLEYLESQGIAAATFDLRNHEPGPPLRKRGVRIKDYVADLASAVDSMEESPIVLGHSMGGFIVQHYLRQSRPAGVVLMASVPPAGVLRTTLRIALRFPLRFLLVNLRLRLYPLVASEKLCRYHFLSSDVDAEVAREVAASVVDESFIAFLDMLAFSLPGKIRDYATPTLVLCAEKDTIFTPAESARTASRYGAELASFPEVAHDMMLDPQWQKVADRVIQWMAANQFVSG